MVALVQSCTLVGIDALPVDVECSIAAGQLPSYNVVGLPAPSVKEGAVRIKSALASCGHELPLKRVTVNLAPADLRKVGCALDLPTAVSILLADDLYSGELLTDVLVLGELGLDGTVRPVRGVLAAAMLARSRGLRGIVVPDACGGEALLVDGIDVYGVAHIQQIVDALRGEAPLPFAAGAPRRRRRRHAVDMSDVRGQLEVRHAIEIAVAGGHNLLLGGPPGTGKTMLARRIATVLPRMTRAEALETTKIYSALGLADGLIDERPFRAPHHTISGAALIGGGGNARPGEISLAHNGVLFLDELPEFSRGVLEALREPLEERAVTIGRASATHHYPASFLLVGAANPCPCGWLGSNVRECTCSNFAIERYRSRLSGPLLDRIDLQVTVRTVTLTELRKKEPTEPSSAMRDRVAQARDRQRARLARWDLRCNAEMTARVLREACPLDEACEQRLAELVFERRTLSARAIDRVIKVARTLADLEGVEHIGACHLSEAAGLRAVDHLSDLAFVDPDERPSPRVRHRDHDQDEDQGDDHDPSLSSGALS